MRVAEEFPDNRSNSMFAFSSRSARSRGAMPAPDRETPDEPLGMPASYGMESPCLSSCGYRGGLHGLGRGPKDRRPGSKIFSDCRGGRYVPFAVPGSALSETERSSRPVPTEMERARRQYVIAWKLMVERLLSRGRNRVSCHLRQDVSHGRLVGRPRRCHPDEE